MAVGILNKDLYSLLVKYNPSAEFYIKKESVRYSRKIVDIDKYQHKFLYIQVEFYLCIDYFKNTRMLPIMLLLRTSRYDNYKTKFIVNGDRIINVNKWLRSMRKFILKFKRQKYHTPFCLTFYSYRESKYPEEIKIDITKDKVSINNGVDYTCYPLGDSIFKCIESIYNMIETDVSKPKEYGFVWPF